MRSTEGGYRHGCTAHAEGVLPWGDGSSVLSLMVTDLTTSKVGSITGVEEDPQFAFIAKKEEGVNF